jgi:hypothetical protein
VLPFQAASIRFSRSVICAPVFHYGSPLGLLPHAFIEDTRIRNFQCSPSEFYHLQAFQYLTSVLGNLQFAQSVFRLVV